jgi:hypothetical protein
MRSVQFWRRSAMMSGVSRRGWDVRSRAAGARGGLAGLVGLAVLAGCGQARFSAPPPEPAFTRGIPAETTVATIAPSTTVADPITMVRSTEPHVLITEPAEPDSEPPAAAPPTSAPTLEGDEPVSEAVAPGAVSVAVDPSAMVIIDDAGVMVPNQSGW